MIMLMAFTTGTEPIVLDLKSLEQLPFVFGKHYHSYQM